MSALDAGPTWVDFIEGLELYRDAIICGGVAGLVLGYLGVYVVLRRLVFVPLAVTHAAGLGVTLAFFAQLYLGQWVDPMAGAFVLALAATTLFIRRPQRVTSESVIGLVYVLAAGATVVFGSRITQESHEVGAIIFGTAVVVLPIDLYATVTVGGGVLALLVWLRRGMVFACFDPDGARVQQVPVRLLETFLYLSLGLMVAVTTRALGALPVFALSVLPAVAALSFVRRIGYALPLAGAIGAASAVVGYVLSFFLELPVGASQVVVVGAVAGSAMLLGRVLR